MTIKTLDKRKQNLDDDDKSNIIPDGQGVRVSMMLMDGMDDVQREIASTKAKVVDAWNCPAGHRPGYVFDRSTNEARYEAREEWIAEMKDVWRTPYTPPTAVTVTTDTRPAPKDTRDPQAIRDAAWAEMVHDLTNAWRAKWGAPLSNP